MTEPSGPGRSATDVIAIDNEEALFSLPAILGKRSILSLSPVNKLATSTRPSVHPTAIHSAPRRDRNTCRDMEIARAESEPDASALLFLSRDLGLVISSF